jgi:hypothetical protein
MGRLSGGFSSAGEPSITTGRRWSRSRAVQSQRCTVDGLDVQPPRLLGEGRRVRRRGRRSRFYRALMTVDVSGKLDAAVNFSLIAGSSPLYYIRPIFRASII